MNNNITFKLGTSPEELEGAFTVRRKVFINEQRIDEDEEYDGLDDDCLQFVAKDSNRIVGTARVRILLPECAKIERMAVLKKFRRQGIGTGIISCIEEELQRRSVMETLLHAQTIVVPFYQACGFQTIGDKFYEAGIEHIEMRKKINNLT